MPVNPTLPTPDPDSDVWGTTLNTAVDAVAGFANGLETALAGKAPTTRTITAGTGLTGGGDLSADRSLAVAYGTTAGTAAQGNDARLSDARVPTAHVHSADDVTSGTLPLARGGTGATTAAGARAALGLGVGAGIYRASTSIADTASGVRTMTGYDTTLWADTGYTVDHGAGTITVPSAGLYLVEAHARFSAAYTGGSAAIVIGAGATELSRSTLAQCSVGGISDIQHTGTAYLTGGASLISQIFTTTSTSLVGNAAGVHYLFRVVRIG